MQKSLFIYKYKAPESQWLNWSECLIMRKDEVIASLKREGLIMEVCFTDQALGYVFFVLIGEDIKKANQIFLNSSAKIDVEHAIKLTECLEFVAAPKLCFDFQILNIGNTETSF